MDHSFARELALLFRVSVARDIVTRGSSSFASYVVEHSGLFNNASAPFTYADVFNEAYKFIAQNYRAEYVYKNVIANQLLLKRHSLTEALLLEEFRVGKSKADVVIFNGTSTVYEIKTELDNFERLPSQIDAYSHVFDNIYVVTDEKLVHEAIQVLPEYVGIILLNTKNILETFRKSVSNKFNTSPAEIFDVLRQGEYKRILLNQLGYVPAVPNTQMYKECKSLFSNFTPQIAHDSMVEVLRQRIPREDTLSFIHEVPYSMKALSIKLKLSKSEKLLLIESLNNIYLAS